jgi:AcrR family transcriptional regulator
MNRKEAILEAAIHLFAERGFSATPTSAVAKRAGVAEGLIFHHFKNKEGIFIHILKEMIDTYIDGVQVITKKAKTGLEAIESVITFHFRFSEERSREFLVIIRDFPFSLMEPGMPAREMIASRSARTLDIMSKCIERGQRDGSIRELSPEKTASIIRGMLNGISRLQMLGPLPMPELASDVLNFCRHGLAR